MKKNGFGNSHVLPQSSKQMEYPKKNYMNTNDMGYSMGAIDADTNQMLMKMKSHRSKTRY